MPAKLPTDHLLPSAYHLMEVSRRAFLGVATGALASILHPKVVTTDVGSPACGRDHVDCVLLDAEEQCTLPESMAGYESALSSGEVCCLKASAGSVPFAKTIIIPACCALRGQALQQVAAALKGGSCVVLESGAGFATPGDFSAHREWLRDSWNVRVEPPMDLWRSHSDQSRHPLPRLRFDHLSPYIDFHWPLSIKVRDFSRPVPVLAPPEHVVGSYGDRPIASKQTAGKGTLVFLGSPLGPALRAGDAEARRWLEAIIGLARQS